MYDFSEIRVEDAVLPPYDFMPARDGTRLAVRRYRSPANVVVLAIHGSSAEGRYFHAMATALAPCAETWALDLRGHGASGGRRGDVDYIGQLEDDIDDVLAAIRAARPSAKIVLLGHSSGGGLVVRFAGTRRVGVDGWVLLAPFLGHDAPTTRPGSGGWARVDVAALDDVLCGKSGHERVVIHFDKPESVRTGREVLAYTFRMMVSLAPRADLASDLAGLTAPLVIAGDRDESFWPNAYEPLIGPIAGGVFCVLAGVTHLGVVTSPHTFAEIARIAMVLGGESR